MSESGDLKIDWADGVAYLKVTDGKVHETDHVTDAILIDFDEDREVLGIEFLDIKMFTPPTTSGTAGSDTTITATKEIPHE